MHASCYPGPRHHPNVRQIPLSAESVRLPFRGQGNIRAMFCHLGPRPGSFAREESVKVFQAVQNNPRSLVDFSNLVLSLGITVTYLEKGIRLRKLTVCFRSSPKELSG